MFDLFDVAEGETRKITALDRVEKAADEEWKAWILDAIREVALRNPTFTADDVEEWRITHSGPSTHERKALGAAMLKAAKSGYCETTNSTLKSRQKVNHRRPMAVWRSLLYRRDDD